MDRIDATPAPGISPLLAGEAEGVRLLGVVDAYEVPVRPWHWVNALAIVVLALTGFVIGRPLPTMPGEASDSFVTGYIRFAHFTAGYLLAIGLLAHAYWAIVGHGNARELFRVPVTRRSYWQTVGMALTWHAFVPAQRSGRWVSHDPLARMMVFSFVLLCLFMIFTGLALFGEGAQAGSWQDILFGWVMPLFGQSRDVHTWHRLGMWVTVLFVIVHVYMATREDAMGRQSVLSTMLSGYRILKD